MERKNLWAPWRMEYIRGLGEKTDCFLCDYVSSPDKDADHHVLWRTERSLVVFNRFPYNNGHMLIAPRRHIGELEQADEAELLELMTLTRDCQQVLHRAISPQGFNVGINFGRCAGAGLPEHLHLHIVPRWNGDTNYMAVCAQTDVISQSMSELYQRLREISQTEGFPRL
ncbi:MAG: HIT domain-containing protein [Sedimentisphaerales bacterium]|nr:HIT domain-containing protein [Sedimentisphaerales bacterium]